MHRKQQAGREQSRRHVAQRDAAPIAFPVPPAARRQQRALGMAEKIGDMFGHDEIGFAPSVAPDQNQTARREAAIAERQPHHAAGRRTCPFVAQRARRQFVGQDFMNLAAIRSGSHRLGQCRGPTDERRVARNAGNRRDRLDARLVVALEPIERSAIRQNALRLVDDDEAQRRRVGRPAGFDLELQQRGQPPDLGGVVGWAKRRVDGHGGAYSRASCTFPLMPGSNSGCSPTISPIISIERLTASTRALIKVTLAA